MSLVYRIQRRDVVSHCLTEIGHLVVTAGFLEDVVAIVPAFRLEGRDSLYDIVAI